MEIIPGFSIFRNGSSDDWYFISRYGTFCRPLIHFKKLSFRTEFHSVISTFFHLYVPFSNSHGVLLHHLHKNPYFLLCNLLDSFLFSGAYFTINSKIALFRPHFGTLFHKSHIQLTQNIFSFMIWLRSVHRLFTNQSYRKEGVSK